MKTGRTYAIILAAIAILLIAGLFYSGQTAGATTPPTWSEQTQSKNSADAGETVTLSALLKADNGLKSASLNVSAGGTWVTSDTQELSGNQALATFRYVIPDRAPGTQISWNIIFYDTASTKAATGTKNITVSDTIPPQILEQTQEADNVVIGGALLLSARVSDNYKLGSISFESNETGDFEILRTYNVSEKDATVSMSWSNPELKEGTFVGWMITVNDKWGNTKTSDVLAFKVRGCPICPSPSEWSNCEVKSGKTKQTQIYYECNENTQFLCVLRTRTQNCTLGVAREESKSALDAATLAVSTAKGENRDTKAAEELLAEAQDAYTKGDWAGAKSKAVQAESAAKTAEIITPPAPNYLPYVAVAVLIAIAAGVLLKFGKIKLPEKKEKAEEKKTEGTPEKEMDVCAICGRVMDPLYTCAECGRRICTDDTRTYEGKTYCTDDLKKKGLL